MLTSEGVWSLGESGDGVIRGIYLELIIMSLKLWKLV